MSISPTLISLPVSFFAIALKRRAMWMPRVRMPMKTRSPPPSRALRISRQQRSSWREISAALRTRSVFFSARFMGNADDRFEENLGAETDFLGVGPFERAVADAFLARHEN